jgi:beta-N-acetylhexosaminidase
MTAHVVFTGIDPEAPASTSAVVTRDIIRGEIGFDGLLMSDDLSMKALTGTIRERAEAVIRAGSDLTLHCNGVLPEMMAAAEGSPPLAGEAKHRFDKAFSRIGRAEPYDRAKAETKLARVLADHARRSESV